MCYNKFPRESGGATLSLGPMTNTQLHNLPSLCFHPAYGCMWPYLYACRNVFILEYFKVITNEALDTLK